MATESDVYLPECATVQCFKLLAKSRVMDDDTLLQGLLRCTEPGQQGIRNPCVALQFDWLLLCIVIGEICFMTVLSLLSPLPFS